MGVLVLKNKGERPLPHKELGLSNFYVGGPLRSLCVYFFMCVSLLPKIETAALVLIPTRAQYVLGEYGFRRQNSENFCPHQVRGDLLDLLFVCLRLSELTEFSAEVTEFGSELTDFSLTKQCSRNKIPLVYCSLPPPTSCSSP